MTWFRKYKILIVILLVFSFLLLSAPSTNATSVIWSSVNDNCRVKGNCSSCDIIQIVVNLGVFMLGIIGAIALLFFVYGGFFWLTSGGAPERVQKGKSILINSVIGLVIALLAYTSVIFIIRVATGNQAWTISLNCSAPATSGPGPGATCTAPAQCVVVAGNDCTKHATLTVSDPGTCTDTTKTCCKAPPTSAPPSDCKIDRCRFATPPPSPFVKAICSKNVPAGCPSGHCFRLTTSALTTACATYLGTTTSADPRVGCYCVPSGF